jgi:hypothetical protein
MTARMPVLLVLALAHVALAQVVSSPTPICFTINDVGSATPAGAIVLPCSVSEPSAAFIAHFAAPASATVDFIAIWAPPAQGAGTQIELFSTAVLGGPSTGPALGSFLGFDAAASGWDPCWRTTPAPVVLASGATYAIRIRQVGSGAPQYWWACSQSCYTFAYDPAGATPLLYQYTSGSCASSVPPTGQLALPIRFGGLACGPGPLASVQWTHSACGGSGPFPSDFVFTAPPVLGSSFPLTVVGSAGDTAFLCWCVGVAPPHGGIPLTPAPSVCFLRLDSQSFVELAALGLEPLASGALAPTASGSGIVNWAFDLPSDPALAGFQIGIQSVVIGPSGTVPLLPGVNARLTPAYQLSLGY